MNYSGTDQNQRIQAGGTSYTNSPLGVSSQTDTGGTTYYTRDSRGNLIDERTPTGTYYYLFDGLGSVVGVTDTSGNLVGNERYQYDPYGNLLQAPVSSVLQSNIWRFAGGQFDSGTGLTKFGVRYYDPTVGRWTQQDPKGGSLFDPRSSNRYVYAKCDPVNVIDPGGKAPGPLCAGALSAIVLGTISAIQAVPWALGIINGILGFASAAGTGGVIGGLAALGATFIGVIVVSAIILGAIAAIYALSACKS
jgi:RHS repeat-associated protein